MVTSRDVSSRVVVPETGLLAAAVVGGDDWKAGDLRESVAAPVCGLRGNMEL